MKFWSLTLFALFSPCASALGGAENPETIPLEGVWKFSADAGASAKTSGEVKLPGDAASQGFGFRSSPDTKWIGNMRKAMLENPRYAKYLESDDNFKLPCFLQPDMYFRGVAEYSRDVEIPPDTLEGRLTLSLERPHGKTALWVNGNFAGERLSYGTPHEYDIAKLSKAGKNEIKIAVDNNLSLDLGVDAHSVSDHTQGNWNGIAGEMSIRASSQSFIDDAQIFPSSEPGKVKIRVRISGDADEIEIRAEGVGKNAHSAAARTFKTQGQSLAEFGFDFGPHAQFWSEYAANLYRVEIFLKKGGNGICKKSFTYGLRNIEARGNKIFVNGLQTFFRGTLECCIFPLTGYPPIDKESWLKIMRTFKKYGLNHVRFHSWCPPEAAFEAADEEGVYIQIENSNWAVRDASRLGMGNPIDAWVYEETDAILKAYGNHPSFVLYSQGNEPHGKTWQERDAYLAKWCEHYKKADARRLYCAGSGWPFLNESDYHLPPDPRLQAWGEGLKSIINARPPSTDFDFESRLANMKSTPAITHEMGQWCAYPAFDTMKKYAGNLKPRSFEIFMDFLKEENLESQAQDFLMASGKLQLLCYKADIEAALRTKNLSGFQLLDLRDFPGQGTALVGILDPFWEPKGYADEKDFTKFCAPLVPLAVLEKFVFKKGELIKCGVKISNYSEGAIKDARVRTSLLDADGKKIHSYFFNTDIVRGIGHYGTFLANADKFDGPCALKLKMEILKDGKLIAENSWNIWCFDPPAERPQPAGVQIFESAGGAFEAAAERGGKIWLKLKPDAARKERWNMGFSSIFWNTLWTDGQAPNTLGILCRPAHPVFRKFPTEFHSDWQWWEIVKNSAPINVSKTRADVLIQVVPDWFNPKKLALAFEAKCGNAKVLVSCIDFDAPEPNLALRQLEASISSYMESGDFSPSTEIDAKVLKGLD